VSALPLIAAVRRVRQPGCKFDELLILESEQGALKSGALRALCPDESYFSDDLPLGVDSKLTIERTMGKWIIEASELYGCRGREVEQLKAFLSRQADGPVRLAYARLPVVVPRHSS
jgi:predicted P-loop ATPase